MLRELGEPKVGAINHIGLTTTLSWAHWLAVALVAQPTIVRSYTDKKKQHLRGHDLSASLQSEAKQIVTWNVVLLLS